MSAWPLCRSRRHANSSVVRCSAHTSPEEVAAKTSVGDYDDLDAVARFAEQVDVATCEFENVPAATLEAAGAAGDEQALR